MSLSEQLLEIENALWTDGAPAYRAHVDERCLLAFDRLAGEFTRDEVVGMIDAGPRWEAPQLELKGTMRPSGDVVFMTYEARATRGAEHYHALVSSGYVEREDGWKLCFHQHTAL